MEIPLLTDIFKLFSLSMVVLYVCTRLRIPTIVGLLITGVVAGPHGLALVHEIHAVEVMAEVGIVLLLFTIGMEFSIEQLLLIKKSVVLGGGIQVFLTLGATFVVSVAAGLTPSEAVATGFLLSLSSTAIVLKLLQERGEMDTPHEKSALGILLFQDLAVVPMMLLLPLLSGQADISTDTPQSLGIGLAAIVMIFLIGRWGIPRLLHAIAKTRDREFFLLSVVAICLGIAWASGKIGLSLSLGAFLAGLLISESEYSFEALSIVLPFKDVFTTFFFLSIGMLLNPAVIVNQPGLIFALTAGVLTL